MLNAPYQFALQEYGIKAIVGAIHNPDVLKYFSDIGAAWVRDDETAWCAAFVNWCLMKAKLKYSGQLNARSFLTYGTATETPKLGDIVVLWRISRDGPYGHVGFFVKQTHDQVFILAGNQSNAVNITAFDKNFLLGYRSIMI